MIVFGWHHTSQTEEYSLSGTDNRGFTREFTTARDPSVRLTVSNTYRFSQEQVEDATMRLRVVQRSREDFIFPMTDQMTRFQSGTASSTSLSVGPNRDYWMGFLVVFRANGQKEWRRVLNPQDFLPPSNTSVVALDTPLSLGAGDEVFPAFQGFLRDGGRFVVQGYNNVELTVQVEARFRFDLCGTPPAVTPILGREAPLPLQEGLETSVRLPQTFFDNGLGPVEAEPETNYLVGRRQLIYRPQSLSTKSALRAFLLSLRGKQERFIVPDFFVDPLGATLPLEENDVTVFCEPPSGVPLETFIGDYLVYRTAAGYSGVRIIGGEGGTLLTEPMDRPVPVGSPVGVGSWCRLDTDTLSIENAGPGRYRVAVTAREAAGPLFTPESLNPQIDVSLAYLPVWVNEIPADTPANVSLAVVLVAEIGLAETGL
jgi:hypothetical protein